MGTETALSCLQLQDCLHLGAWSQLQSLWDKARLGSGFWCWTGFLSSWGCNPHNQSSLLPAPAAQTPSPPPSPLPSSCTTLGIKAPECLLLSGIPQDHHQHLTACLQAPVLSGHRAELGNCFHADTVYQEGRGRESARLKRTKMDLGPELALRRSGHQVLLTKKVVRGLDVAG